MFAKCALARAVVVAVLAASPLPALGDPGGNGNGDGNAYGWGFGNGQGNGNGGGRGGPLPVLGATLLGQLGLVAGGALLLWRRRATRRPGERRES